MTVSSKVSLSSPESKSTEKNSSCGGTSSEVKLSAGKGLSGGIGATVFPSMSLTAWLRMERYVLALEVARLMFCFIAFVSSTDNVMTISVESACETVPPVRGTEVAFAEGVAVAFTGAPRKVKPVTFTDDASTVSENTSRSSLVLRFSVKLTSSGIT